MTDSIQELKNIIRETYQQERNLEHQIKQLKELRKSTKLKIWETCNHEWIFDYRAISGRSDFRSEHIHIHVHTATCKAYASCKQANGSDVSFTEWSAKHNKAAMYAASSSKQAEAKDSNQRTNGECRYSQDASSTCELLESCVVALFAFHRVEPCIIRGLAM